MMRTQACREQSTVSVTYEVHMRLKKVDLINFLFQSQGACSNSCFDQISIEKRKKISLNPRVRAPTATRNWTGGAATQCASTTRKVPIINNQTIINNTQVCDGKEDCSDGGDEQLCNFICYNMETIAMEVSCCCCCCCCCCYCAILSATTWRPLPWR